MAGEQVIRLGADKKRSSKASMIEALEEAIEAVKNGDTAGLLVMLMTRDEAIDYRAEPPDILMGGAALIGATQMVVQLMASSAWDHEAE